jgi:PIN domain nuclease of toxin-antitoxin system
MRRLLLDTHIALWAITADSRLGAKTRARLVDPDNQIYVSAASIWEIAIKHQKNPTAMPIGPDIAMQAMSDSGFIWLDISARHAAASAQLPMLHADPFDRMLIAQARTEPLALLTRDAQLAAYSELVILV